MTERGLLRLSGGLLVVGLVLLLVVTMGWHPGGEEDNHPVIFQKYADSDPWVVVHMLQFAGVLIALGGLVGLYRVLAAREDAVPLLARCALGATIVAGATFTVLQAVDGVALKHTVDEWAASSGTQRDLRFADAETVRWTEWGLQSYFRFVLGVALLLFGMAIDRTTVVPRWLGWIAGLGGLLYIATSVSVGLDGLETPGDPLPQLLFLVFAFGVLLAGVRGIDRSGVTESRSKN